MVNTQNNAIGAINRPLGHLWPLLHCERQRALGGSGRALVQERPGPPREPRVVRQAHEVGIAAEDRRGQKPVCKRRVAVPEAEDGQQVHIRNLPRPLRGQELRRPAGEAPAAARVLPVGGVPFGIGAAGRAHREGAGGRGGALDRHVALDVEEVDTLVRPQLRRVAGGGIGSDTAARALLLQRRGDGAEVEGEDGDIRLLRELPQRGGVPVVRGTVEGGGADVEGVVGEEPGLRARQQAGNAPRGPAEAEGQLDRQADGDHDQLVAQQNDEGLDDAEVEGNAVGHPEPHAEQQDLEQQKIANTFIPIKQQSIHHNVNSQN